MPDNKHISPSRSPRVAIVIFPSPSPVHELLLVNLAEVLESFCEAVHIVSYPFPLTRGATFGSRVKFERLTTRLHHAESIQPRWWSICLWGMKNVWIQIQTVYRIIALAQHVEAVILLGVAYYHLLPLICAKLLRKRVAVTVWDRPSFVLKKGHRLSRRQKLFLMLQERIETLVFGLVDQLAVESEAASEFLELDRYANKVSIYSCPYVDIERFQTQSRIDARADLVGYIGRLTVKKGITNFVRSFPLLANDHPKLRFIIAGEGSLSKQIEKELDQQGVLDRVELVGWIPHDEMPRWLNRLKVLVLPSISEGVPGIVKEAMACGAAVVATPVGGIPDLIRDGETGFITKNNSPAIIAATVTRALLDPKLEKIVENARCLIEQEYDFSAMARSAQRGIDNLLGDLMCDDDSRKKTNHRPA